MVSNNKASGLSARTGDLVHKQVKPHEHEYKLSKVSGIQVHPLTKTLTWSILSSPHSESLSATCKEADRFDDLRIRSLCFSLNRAQPTWESHFLKALYKSVNGSGMDLLIGILGSWMGLMEADMEGNSRKPKKKRIRNTKPNIRVEMVKELRDFNNMVCSI